MSVWSQGRCVRMKWFHFYKFSFEHVHIYIYMCVYIGSGSLEIKLFLWDQHFLHETSQQNTVKVKKIRTFIVKNTVNVTFMEFFDVNVHFLLPSQHIRCEGWDYLFVTFTAFSLWRFRFLTLFWIFFTQKSVF